MESFLDKNNEFNGVEYPDYYLGKNPFPTASMVGGYTSGDKLGAFWQRIFFKEANRLTNLFQERSFQEKPKAVLIKKEPYVRTRMTNAIFGILLRNLLHSSNPRVLPLEDSLPLIYRSFFDSFWRNCSDYIQYPQFKTCIYAFLYQELKKLKTGEIKAELPDIDLNELFKEIEESEGQVLEDIFVLPTEEEDQEEVKEETKEDDINVDELEDGEMKDFVSEVQRLKEERRQQEEIATQAVLPKPKTEVDPRREPLLGFFNDQIERSNLSEHGKNIIKKCLDESYLDGFTLFRTKKDTKESIKDILRITTNYYHKVVYLIDHMEGWQALEEDEKGKLIGEMAEIPFVTEGHLIMGFLVSDQVFEYLSSDSFPSNEIIELELELVQQNPEEISGLDKIREILRIFINADRYRSLKIKEMEEKGLSQEFPFTDDGIEALFEKSEKDILRLIPYAYEIIEQGKQAGYVKIDKGFVDKAKIGPQPEDDSSSG